MTTPPPPAEPGDIPPADPAPGAPADPAAPPNAPDPATDPVEPGGKAGAEAARYRRQLRDTETERDGLRERITSYERAEAERLAAGTLAAGTDLWAAGVQLEDLRGEDGALDPEKVTEAVSGIVADRPHWRRPPTPRPDHRQGGGQQDATGGRSWSDVFRGRR